MSGKKTDEDPNKYRIKSLFLDYFSLEELLIGRRMALREGDCVVWYEPLNLPKDVKVVSIFPDANRFGIVMHLRSKEFPEVIPGQHLDRLDIGFEQRKVAVVAENTED